MAIDINAGAPASADVKPGRTYDAFISYSHAADAQLAPAIERGLRGFALPFWRRLVRLWSLRIFRDETTLAMTPHLWPTIVSGLDRSRHFVLLASPEAAASPWVEKEIAHWLAKDAAAERLFIVRTSGKIAWDPVAEQFSADKTDCIPPSLLGRRMIEPKWGDAVALKTAGDLQARNPVLQQILASLYSAITGRPLDEVIGEDIRRQRQARAMVATTALSFIAIIALGAVGAFYLEKKRALEGQANYAVEFARGRIESGEPSLGAALLLETLDRSPELFRSAAALDLRWTLINALHALNERRVMREQKPVRLMALHPSDDVLATVTGSGSQSRAMAIWNRESGEKLSETEAPYEIIGLDFISSGVVAISATGKLLQWDWKGKNQPTENDIAKAATKAVFDRNTGRVAFINEAGAICIASSGEAVKQCPVVIAGDIRFTDLKWRADGRLQTVSEVGAVSTYAAEGGAPVSVLNLPTDAAEIMTGSRWRLSVSPKGDRAVTWLGTVRDWKPAALLWDLDQQKLMDARLKGSFDDDYVTNAVFSPDGDSIALVTRRRASVWSVATGQVRAYMFGHQSYINGAAFSPNGEQFATWSYDGSARIWSARDGRSLQVLTGPKELLNGGAFSPDGCSFIAVSNDATVSIWSLVGEVGATRLSNAPCPGGPAGERNWPLFNGAFSPDAAFVATSTGKQVRVWDTGAGALTRTLAPRGQRVTSASFGAGGRLIALGEAASPDGAAAPSNPGEISIHDWRDGESGRETARLQTSAAVASVAFNGAGTRLIAALADGTAPVWTIDSDGNAKIELTLNHGAMPLNGATWSADGTEVVTFSQDKFACVWSLTEGGQATGKRCLPEKLNDQVMSAAWSSDGRQLLLADGDGWLSILDGKTLQTIRNHKLSFNRYPLRAIFAPADLAQPNDDKRHVIALLDSREFVVLETQNWRTVYQSRAGEQVVGIAVSRDGRKLFTTRRDKTVQIAPFWLRSEELIREVKSRLSRCLSASERAQFLSISASGAAPEWCRGKRKVRFRSQWQRNNRPQAAH